MNEIQQTSAKNNRYMSFPALTAAFDLVVVVDDVDVVRDFVVVFVVVVVVVI